MEREKILKLFDMSEKNVGKFEISPAKNESLMITFIGEIAQERIEFINKFLEKTLKFMNKNEYELLEVTNRIFKIQKKIKEESMISKAFKHYTIERMSELGFGNGDKFIHTKRPDKPYIYCSDGKIYKDVEHLTEPEYPSNVVQLLECGMLEKLPIYKKIDKTEAITILKHGGHEIFVDYKAYEKYRIRLSSCNTFFNIGELGENGQVFKTKLINFLTMDFYEKVIK